MKSIGQAKGVLPIGVAGEDAPLVVAALGKVEPISGRGEALSVANLNLY